MTTIDREPVLTAALQPLYDEQRRLNGEIVALCAERDRVADLIDLLERASLRAADDGDTFPQAQEPVADDMAEAEAEEPEPPANGFVPIAEAAQRVGRSRPTLNNRVTKGELRAIRTPIPAGRGYRLLVDLDQALALYPDAH